MSWNSYTVNMEWFKFEFLPNACSKFLRSEKVSAVSTSLENSNTL